MHQVHSGAVPRAGAVGFASVGEQRFFFAWRSRARQIARQPAGTCTMRRKCSPTFVGVCSARAVRQHHLCAAERRLMVTPPGAQKRRNRPFACLFDRIRGHRLNKKCSQFREKPIPTLAPACPTSSSGIIRDPPFWAIFGTITPVRAVPESPPQGHTSGADGDDGDG